MFEQIDLKNQQLDAKCSLTKYTVQGLLERLYRIISNGGGFGG